MYLSGTFLDYYCVIEKNIILLQFGQRIRTLRKEKGLSQEAFADLVGLDRSYIGGVERGMRNVSLANIQKLAAALEISIQDIFQGV